jgi:diaminopimelate decarboxylase
MGSRQSELNSAFFRIIRSREKVLSRDVLQGYVEGFLTKREIFIESARRFGAPQYFFDRTSLAQKADQFNAACSRHLDRYQIFYAMKSNSFRGIIDHIASRGMGLDVSSGHELSMALATGCQKIIFSGPGKTDEELGLAISHPQQVVLLMDSPGELSRLSKIVGQKRGSKAAVRVGIRVQNAMGGVWNKFGIPLSDVTKTFINAMSIAGIDPCGIQFHTSWNLNPSAQVKMIDQIGSYIVRKMPEDISRRLKFMDIGGGFWPEHGEWLNAQNTDKGALLAQINPESKFNKTHYIREAMPIDYFLREISRAISRPGNPLQALEVWMEPGRWISTSAMHILLKVVDKKGSRMVITDGGINIMGWERPLTEFIPIINLSQPGLNEVSTMVFGSLCTPHDVWGRSFFGNGIEVGDVLLVPDQGAYTYSLRQSFIKAKCRVVQYDGKSLKEVEMQEY